MFKNIFVFVLMLIGFISHSQETVNSFPLNLKNNSFLSSLVNGSKSNWEVFQVTDEVSQMTALFLSDKKTVNAFLLNDKMEMTDSLSTERPDNQYSKMIGYAGDQSNPRIFWSNDNHTEIFSQKYNFKKNTVSEDKASLELSNERFLQCFSENKKLYVLTVVEYSDKMKLYVFDSDGKFEVKIISSSTFKFFNAKSKQDLLYFLIYNNSTTTELQKITTDSPTSLVECSEKIKCYSSEKQITITIDNNPSFTQLITIDLDNYATELKNFDNPAYTDTKNINSNSFLIDNKLFQMVLSSSKLFMTIKDLNGNIIKEYSAIETEPINFKNSNIIRLNSYSSSKRILEETSQFLNKVNNSNCGISCYKANGNYIITMGSASEVRARGGNMMMPMNVGGFAAPTFMYIPYGTFAKYDNFDSYANRKVVYIDCYFDIDGNHVSGETKHNVFDKIKGFINQNSENISLKTIFKNNDYYYLGFHDNYTKKYTVKKFTD
jgi:hypothetical protein